MKHAHIWTSLLVVLFTVNSYGFLRTYPTGPDDNKTPGSLCENPSEYKYPEDIPYCDRNVSKNKKKRVIAIYEKQLGFNIYKYDRRNFKIDHLIPLCIGGSNQIDNLWPQHRTVYKITDPLEQVLCVKVQRGLILQVDAVDLILDAKHHLDKTPEIIELVESL